MDADVLLAAALFLFLVFATVSWVAVFHDHALWWLNRVRLQVDWLSALHPVSGG